ncbi:hypothetical protein [uncultured Capnocytophaga sp.]|uniref:hypothetical protein n=1 Tax=uncultured Capnocytophaga sp. TaxID=159273 RepID=UPI00262FF5C0|nr:hypothetical protein [uncultured Capnocytophaga sp.]
MSKKIKNGEQPVTPNSLLVCDDGEIIIANDSLMDRYPSDTIHCIGITKREQIAIEAAKAMLSKGNESIYIVAGKAVLFADALLEKLEKQQAK